MLFLPNAIALIALCVHITFPYMCWPALMNTEHCSSVHGAFVQLFRVHSTQLWLLYTVIQLPWFVDTRKMLIGINRPHCLDRAVPELSYYQCDISSYTCNLLRNMSIFLT